MLTKSYKITGGLFSSAVVGLAILAFLFTIGGETRCAQAQAACGVGDDEIFAGGVGIQSGLAFTTTITAPNATADQTWSHADAPANDIYVGVTSTQNVSGKTFSTSNFVGGSVTGIIDLLVADGGTGTSTLMSNGVVVGQGTGALTTTAVGTAAQVLTSNGVGLDPTFQTAPATGIANVVEDVTPQLGANLDANAFDVVFDDGDGIDYSATTGAAGETSAVLTHYSQGTWTPTIQDLSLSDAESQTYTAQVGLYTRIGDVVYITGHVNALSLASLTGSDAAFIAGLPFTPISTALSHGPANFGQSQGLAIAAGVSPVGLFNPSQTYITLQLFDATTGTTSMTITEFNTGSMFFSGFYRTP